MPNSQNPPGHGREELDRRIDEFVAARLTEERLDNLWDKMQGTATRGDARRDYSWRDQSGDIVVTLWATRIIHKAVGTLAAVGLVMAGIFVWRADELVIRTPANWPLAQALPKELKFRLGQAAVQLTGGTIALTGILGASTRGELNTRTVTMDGVTPNGEPIHFRGTLILTNRPGVSDPRKRREILGALLGGELTIGTNPPIVIPGQPYVP